MRNVVQLFLAASTILLMRRNETTLVPCSFMWSLSLLQAPVARKMVKGRTIRKFMGGGGGGGRTKKKFAEGKI